MPEADDLYAAAMDNLAKEESEANGAVHKATEASARAKARALREVQRGPQVILPSVGPNDDTVTIPHSATNIFRVLAGLRQTFIRGGRVHELRRVGDRDVLMPMSPAEFIARIPRVMDLFAWRRPKDSTVVLAPMAKIPVDTAMAIMAAREAEEILPPVASVLHCPGLAVRDGVLASMTPGYNVEQGGVLVTSTILVPTIPIDQAILRLGSLLDDFAFVSPGDRARALAAVVTPALRLAGLIPGHVPILMIEADASQTGKGFFHAMMTAIYGETASVVTQRQGGVGSMEESLAQRLIEGRPFILFDNLRGKIDSCLLESLLTPIGHYAARVPHRGEVAIDPTHFLYALTSNGVEVTRDLANRASVIRLRKRPAGYVFRTWETRQGHGDLVTHIHEHQAELLGAVHAVARAWFTAGRPTTSERGHSFRGWAAALDWISREIFHAGPLLEGHQQLQERVGDPALIWLRKVAILTQTVSGRSWSASRLAELCIDNGLPVPNVRAETDAEGMARVIGLILRRLLNGTEALDIDGLTMRKVNVHDARQGRDRHEYTFTAPGGPPILLSSKGETLKKNGGVFLEGLPLGGLEEGGRPSGGDSVPGDADAGHDTNVTGPIAPLVQPSDDLIDSPMDGV